MSCNTSSCGSSECPDINGWTSACPDFQIKQNDTRPPFKINIEDENGPIDLTGLVVEVNMWANAKLKRAISITDLTIQFADNIGFYQASTGDVITTCRTRSPEEMLITGFDETNYYISVTRGYNGTTPFAWKKGTGLKIIKLANEAASSEMVYEDVIQIDGTTLTDQLTESLMVYDWKEGDTLSPGCFSFEFQLISITPSTSDVAWIRKFPVCNEFVVKICQ